MNSCFKCKINFTPRITSDISALSTHTAAAAISPCQQELSVVQHRGDQNKFLILALVYGQGGLGLTFSAETGLRPQLCPVCNAGLLCAPCISCTSLGESLKLCLLPELLGAACSCSQQTPAALPGGRAHPGGAELICPHGQDRIASLRYLQGSVSKQGMG